MIFFNKKQSKRDILIEILEELQEIKSIADDQNENVNLGWLLLEKDDKIRKLQEKYNNLKKQVRELENDRRSIKSKK